MEVKILHKFHDRADFTKVYPVGETFNFDDARAEYLIELGLAEKTIERVAEAVKPAATRKRSASKEN